jgi:endonuclease YncB( thermonuclease family)
MLRQNNPQCILALITLFLLTLFSTTSALAYQFTGKVVAVFDGDTIDVLNGHHTERIRLSGIDCPEKGQAYGNNAKHAVADLPFGKEVTVKTHGRDKYKRTLAYVLLPDGTNVNHTLVKEGWCWWYRKYAPRNTVLVGLEKEAREGWKGVWADPQPVPPWEWRKLGRARRVDASIFRPTLFAIRLVPLENSRSGALNRRS